MTRIKSYDYEKYSTLDIEKYLHEKGYKTQKKIFQNKLMVHVLGTNIYVDIPSISIIGDIFACIRFQNYPRTDHHESDQKLYNLLKRKFALKNGEIPKIIKDADKLTILDSRKKGIWPFNKIF